MNKYQVNNLFQKRIFAFFVDFAIVFIISPLFLTNIGSSILSLLFNISIIILIYYVFIPLLTNGRTIGLFLFKIKLIHLREKTYFKKLNSYFFRIISSLATFYIFRIFLTNKINNNGQLKFDEKYQITIANNNFKKNENIYYFDVNFDIINFVKLFFIILFMNIVYSYIY